MNHQAKLSERIVQDVVDRLVSGRELPFRLNVLGMARHYGISRTPVREAIEELQRLGKLTKLSNGRFASTHYTEQTPLSVPVVISVRDIGDSHLDNSLGDNSLGDNSLGDNSLGDSHLKGLKSHLDNQSGPLKDGTVHFCPQIDSKTDGDNPVCPQIETLDNPSLSVPHVGPVSEVGHIKLSVPVSGTQVGVEKLSVPATTSGPIRTSGLSASWSHLDWRDGVRQHLVEEVVRLSLRGQTTFLREQVWSDRLEIGRGLLRQMLSELAGLGFVEHVPRRGWQVRPFDANAMLQYLEIREVLELHALELAKDHLDPQRLQTMLAGNPTNVGGSVPGRSKVGGSVPGRSNVGGSVPGRSNVGGSVPGRSEHMSVPIEGGSNVGGSVPGRSNVGGSVPGRSGQMSVPETLFPETLNNEIHGYLIQQSRNRYIADFFARHSTYYSQLFEMAAVQTGWRDAMAQQHRAILEALLNQDIPRAKHALAHHIRAQRPVVQELLRQVLERPQ